MTGEGCAMASAAALLVERSLLEEVHTTPKPGLVDRDNAGSHRDMGLAHFEASAAALTPFWERFVLLGEESAPLGEEESFRLLRSLGLRAEARMLSATGGVNTHKGAIFLFGALCAAIGRTRSHDPDTLLRDCALLSRGTLLPELDALRRGERAPRTAGERLAALRIPGGARGELAAGLPGAALGLREFERALAAGLSRNDALAVTLLHLVARGTDSNLFARGGAEGAAWAAEACAALLRRAPFPSVAEIRALDAAFIRRKLSPGGSADLLALSIFLHDWQRQS